MRRRSSRDSSSAWSLMTLALLTRSSASSQKTHSPAACRKLSLRAAEKSSHQGKSKILDVNRAATSRVRSCEPVSTITISSKSAATGVRHSARFASPFLTIMHSETVALRLVVIYPPSQSGWRLQNSSATGRLQLVCRQLVLLGFPLVPHG